MKMFLKVWRLKDLIEGKIVSFQATCYVKSCASACDKECPSFCCRTIEYYEKKLYLARKKTKNKTLYPT